MYRKHTVAVVIPVLNEAQNIAKVLACIPVWVDQVIVADNGSTDNTAEVAHTAGADVAHAVRRGYGAACLAGVAIAKPCDIIVFVDGDFSDFPEQMERLVAPIASDQVQLVIGSRALGYCAPGAMTVPQRFGNRLACFLIRKIWGVNYSDLGPFRAIRRNAYETLNMKDQAFGWTVEMQLKAIIHRLKVREVPVDYRARAFGQSKVSGTIKGVFLAGTTIIGKILQTALCERPLKAPEYAGRNVRASADD